MTGKAEFRGFRPPPDPNAPPQFFVVFGPLLGRPSSKPPTKQKRNDDPKPGTDGKE